MKTYQQQLAVYGRDLPNSSSFRPGSRAYKSKCKAILDVAKGHVMFIHEVTGEPEDKVLLQLPFIHYRDLVKFAKLKQRLPTMDELMEIKKCKTFEMWFDKHYIQPATDEDSVYWMGSDAYTLYHSL